MPGHIFLCMLIGLRSPEHMFKSFTYRPHLPMHAHWSEISRTYVQIIHMPGHIFLSIPIGLRSPEHMFKSFTCQATSSYACRLVRDLQNLCSNHSHARPHLPMHADWSEISRTYVQIIHMPGHTFLCMTNGLKSPEHMFKSFTCQATSSYACPLV